MALLEFLSIAMGWTYVACWSVSFYPQLLLNIKLRSSDGVSLDFLYLNTFGYITYLTSLTLQVYNSTVRKQFYARYGDYPLLSLIDITYAAHGLVLNLVIASQMYFWNFTRNSSRKVHQSTKYIISAVLLLVGFQLFLIYKNQMQYVELALNLAYIKIFISFVKYIPQLYHNYSRHSCAGFSIVQIWLDFSGGTFAVLQLFLDNYIDNHHSFKWQEILHNKGKLGLSLVTFFFDFCFLLQYYIIYKEHLSHKNYTRNNKLAPTRSSSSDLLLPSTPATIV